MILEETEERKVKRAAKWERNEPVRVKKGITVRMPNTLVWLQTEKTHNSCSTGTTRRRLCSKITLCTQ